MLNDRSRVLIGLGRDVEISQTALCFGWKYSLPHKHCSNSTQRLTNIQTDTTNSTPSPDRSISDDEALGQWARDSFDIVVIHLPLTEKIVDTYKQLIRVARQGLILLGATHSRGISTRESGVIQLVKHSLSAEVDEQR